MLPNAVKGVWASLSIQLLIATGIRGYPLVGKPAWFIYKQSPVDVGHQILLVNSKVAQMPSMTLSCGFARLLNKGAATEPENRGTQKNRQQQKRCAFGAPDDTNNRPNESVFHCYFLLKIGNLRVLSRQGYSSGPRKVRLRPVSTRRRAEVGRDLAKGGQEPLNITQTANAVTSKAKDYYISLRSGCQRKSQSAVAVFKRGIKRVFLCL
jgi:hypothetical protein